MYNLKPKDKIRVTGFDCGHNCEHRLNCMGILEGKVLTIKSLQPFGGPITVSLGDCECCTFTIGQGMFEKIRYVKL